MDRHFDYSHNILGLFSFQRHAKRQNILHYFLIVYIFSLIFFVVGGAEAGGGKPEEFANKEMVP